MTKGLTGPITTMLCPLSIRSNHPLIAGIPKRNSCRLAATNWEDLLPVPSYVFITYTSSYKKACISVKFLQQTNIWRVILKTICLTLMSVQISQYYIYYNI